MKTKAPPPISHLDGKSTHPLIRAWFEMAQLKQLYRQGWLRVGIPEATATATTPGTRPS